MMFTMELTLAWVLTRVLAMVMTVFMMVFRRKVASVIVTRTLTTVVFEVKKI